MAITHLIIINIFVTIKMEVKLNTDKWLFQTFNAQPHSNLEYSKLSKQVSTMPQAPSQNAYGLFPDKTNLHHNHKNALQINRRNQSFYRNKLDDQSYNRNQFTSQPFNLSPIKTNTRQNSINSKMNSRHLQMSKQQQSILSKSRNKNEVIEHILQNIRKLDSPRNNIQNHCKNTLIQKAPLAKATIYNNPQQKALGRQEKQFKQLRQTIFDRHNRDIVDNFTLASRYTNNGNPSPLHKIDEKRKQSIQRKTNKNIAPQHHQNILCDSKNGSTKQLKQSKSSEKQIEFMKAFCTQPLNIKSSVDKKQSENKQNQIINIKQDKGYEQKFNLQKNFLKQRGNMQIRNNTMKGSNGKPPIPRPLSKSPSAQLFSDRGNSSLDKNFKASPIHLFAQKKQSLVNEYYNEIAKPKLQKIQQQLNDFRVEYQREQRKLKQFYNELELMVQQMKTKDLTQLKKYEEMYENKFNLCKEIIRKQNANLKSRKVLENDKTNLKQLKYEQCDRILMHVRQTRRNVKVTQNFDINFKGFVLRSTSNSFGRELKKPQNQIVSMKQAQKGNTFSFDKMII